VEIPGGILFPCPIRDKYSRKDPTAWVKGGRRNEIRLGKEAGEPQASWTWTFESHARNFVFRRLHSNILIGTASDRYAGCIGQVYSEGRYEKRITKRSHKVGDKTFNEETLSDESLTEYFDWLKYFSQSSQRNNPERRNKMTKIRIESIPLLFFSPVILVTCQDGESKPNIITIAWTGVVNSQPPMIGIAIQPIRYSHAIIRTSGEFGVNIPTKNLLHAVDYCGTISGRNVDKFKMTGLTPMATQRIKAPLIQECPVNLECLVRFFLTLGMHDLFIGEIVSVHVDEQALDSKRQLDSAKLDPIGYFSQTRDYWSLKEKIGLRGFTKGDFGP
jgi:flavin reductase (DIM6/NTAB) family NADH-FMN oxidoreductase RutF